MTYRSHGTGTGGATDFQFYDAGSEPSYDYGCVPTPPKKRELGDPPDKECNPPQLVLDPINIFNGNNYNSAIDLTLGPLKITRSYSSQSSSPGEMGFGWSLAYSAFLTPSFDIAGTPYVEITDSTGRGVYFQKQDETTFTAAFQEKTTLTRDNLNYIWHRLDGSEYHFNEHGRLMQISSPIGNIITLIYNSDPLAQTVVTTDLLLSVTDEITGRTLIINYNTDNLISSISVLTSSAVPDNVLVSYGYDSIGNLISVTYADGSGFDYEYADPNDPHNLTAEKDKMDHVLATWAYDDQDRAIENTTSDGRGGSINYVNLTTVMLRVDLFI